MQQTIDLRQIWYGVRACTPWVAIFLVAFMAIFTGNTLAIGVCAAIGIWWAFLWSDPNLEKLFALSWRDRFDRQTYFRNREDFWKAVGLPICIGLFSLFFYVPWVGYAYAVVEENGEIEYFEGWSIGFINPVIDKVRFFSDSHTISVDSRGVTDLFCMGKTGDGRGMIANLGGNFSLPFEGLADAYRQAGSNTMLRQLLRSELCDRFAAVVGTYPTIDALPATLSLESRTADERRGMDRIGLRYSGIVFVGRPHAYIAQ